VAIEPIVIDGIPIPDDRPVFLVVLAVHVLAGTCCVIAGAVAAFARKRRGPHPRAGTVYYASLAAMFVSLVVLSLLRWPANTHLLIIGTVTFAAASVGVRARRRRRHGWLRVHGIAMGTSYIGLLTGFYVDNGPNLPLWRDLPHASYWVLPALIGVPILLVALRRNTRPVTAR
jgi:threonine/homoserine/homoserine lactone efflux protein